MLTLFWRNSRLAREMKVPELFMITETLALKAADTTGKGSTMRGVSRTISRIIRLDEVMVLPGLVC